MKSLSESIAEYLEAGKYERKLAPNTLKAYQIDLRQFSEFAGDIWPDRDMLSGYIKHLNQNFAPRSVKRKLASVRAFFHELMLNGVLEKTRLISCISVFNPLNNFQELSRAQLSKACYKARMMPTPLIAEISYGISWCWSCCLAPAFACRNCVH